MIFGEVPIADAEGALLVHSVRAGKTHFRKGRLLSADDVASLSSAGVERVTVARPEPGDVGEDDAAQRIATALAGDNLSVAQPFTGRCNLIATATGILTLDREHIDQLNLVDESVTVATLPPYEPVTAGDMVATVKIMPFAVPGTLLDHALEHAGSAIPIAVAAYRKRPVALIQTRLPSLKESVLDKTTGNIESRLQQMGASVLPERRCPHEVDAVADALRSALGDGAEIVLIAGASAITDRRDVLPSGIEPEE